MRLLLVGLPNLRLDDLERLNRRSLAKMKHILWSPQENFNEDRSTHTISGKMGPMIEIGPYRPTYMYGIA